MTEGSTAARKPQQLRPVQRVTLLDLTVDQIEEAELAIGLSAKRWDEAPSQGRIFKVVYSIAFGVTVQEAGKLTLRQLQAAVDLNGEDPDPSGPTQPSA